MIFQDFPFNSFIFGATKANPTLIEAAENHGMLQDSKRKEKEGETCMDEAQREAGETDRVRGCRDTEALVRIIQEKAAWIDFFFLWLFTSFLNLTCITSCSKVVWWCSENVLRQNCFPAHSSMELPQYISLSPENQENKTDIRAKHLFSIEQKSFT